MNEKEVTNKDILDALNSLNDNTVANNDSIKELTEYLISKDEKEKEEQEKNEELRAEKEETESKEQETAKAEESAKADSQTETYTELLTSINDNVILTNHLIAGQIFFMGALLGTLLIKILFERFSTRL